MTAPTNVTTTATEAQLQSARKELAKLPLLGPVMWLYARDPQRRFTFVADMDWRLLPPLVLEQCKLYHKTDVPWAYFAWATVSAEVDQRLRSATPIIAPHEWRSGSIPWLIDVVMPFSEEPALIQEVIAQFAKGQKVSAWMPAANGQMTLREFQG
jgi:cytolysin-activating lysine-acyltransferase